MNQATAHALADGYAAYIARGDMSVLGMFSPEFYDNVSGQRGLRIFTTVGGWFEESFAERTVELHLVTHNDDTVMIWYTMRSFPLLRRALNTASRRRRLSLPGAASIPRLRRWRRSSVRGRRRVPFSILGNLTGMPICGDVGCSRP